MASNDRTPGNGKASARGRARANGKKARAAGKAGAHKKLAVKHRDVKTPYGTRRDFFLPKFRLDAEPRTRKVGYSAYVEGAGSDTATRLAVARSGVWPIARRISEHVLVYAAAGLIVIWLTGAK